MSPTKDVVKFLLLRGHYFKLALFGKMLKVVGRLWISDFALLYTVKLNFHSQRI